MIERIKKIDKGILIASLIMMGIGIVFVFSSSFAVAQHKFGGANFFLVRHIARVAMALAGFILFMNLDYHIMGKLGKVGYIIAIIMLIYVLMLPGSAAINGAKRWISLGFMRFQVSEFARLALILCLASQLHKNGDKIREGSVYIQHIIRIGIICVLIVLEPDYSTAMLTAVIGMTLVFIAGARITHIGGIVLSFIPIAIIGVITSPYRYRRLLGYLNIAESKNGIGYQASQAKIGLGNGGIFGTGLGQGEQKFFFLPEPHTDFVFSILGEEIGFIGMIIVFAIFSFIIYRGIRIAIHAPDMMGQLIAFGLTLTTGLYVAMHASVNTGLVPTTGVPLPFISYGGMSLIFTMCSMGIILNISSQIDKTITPIREQRIR